MRVSENTVQSGICLQQLMSVPAIHVKMVEIVLTGCVHTLVPVLRASMEHIAKMVHFAT